MRHELSDLTRARLTRLRRVFQVLSGRLMQLCWKVAAPVTVELRARAREARKVVRETADGPSIDKRVLVQSSRGVARRILFSVFHGVRRAAAWSILGVGRLLQLIRTDVASRGWVIGVLLLCLLLLSGLGPEVIRSSGIVQPPPGRHATSASQIEVFPDGRFVTVNDWADAVEMYSPDGRHLLTIGGAGNQQCVTSHPLGLCLGADGAFYACNTRKHSIAVFNHDGSPRMEFGSAGDRAGQFRDPSGVAINAQQELAVADTGNHRIQLLSPDGDSLLSFGRSGGDVGEFNRPKDVAFFPDGRLAVADTGNHRIQVFDMRGGFLFGFGSSGRQDGQFRSPSAVHIASDGTIFVADTDNHRVQFFDERGEYRGAITDRFRNPGGIYVTDDEIVVGDSGGHSIEVFDRQGNFRYTIGSYGNGEGDLREPHGVVVTDQGTVVTCDTANNRIQVFDPLRNPLFAFGTSRGRNGILQNPQGLAVDASGAIYVADTGNHRIQKFSDSGKYLMVIGRRGKDAGEFDQPGDVTVLSDGQLVVADTYNERIQFFSPEGIFRKLVLLNGQPRLPDLSRPTSLLALPEGRLLIGFQYSRRVVVMDADGSLTGEFETPHWASDFCLGPDELLYVSCRNENRIDVLTLDGQLCDSFGGVGDLFRGEFGLLRGVGRVLFRQTQGCITRPAAAEFLPDGRLIVSDAGDGELEFLTLLKSFRPAP